MVHDFHVRLYKIVFTEMKEETETNQPVKTLSVTPSLLDAFDLLKDPKDEVRLTGGNKILTLLQNNENEKDISYVVKRLVRSLGANTPAYRTGYFATLVSILKRYKQIDVAHLIDLVKKELNAKSSSKSEVGDTSLGQILICSAVFRSGLMHNCSENEQKEVLQLLLNSSKKKSYLGTVAYMVLLNFISQLDEEQFASIVWSNIKPEFKKDIKEHSLDSLYFLMIVNKKFPKKVKLRKLIGAEDVLCEENIHFICEKIMGGIDFNSVNHPIYQEVGREIANSPHLSLFWTSGVDSQLVKHNRNRELVSINMLTTILNNMQQNFDVIPELLSTNFFKLFMDWFKGLQTASKIRNKRNDEDDQKLMINKEKELLNTLAKTLKNDKVNSKVRVEVLKKLLLNPGEVNFNEITGTSIIKTIISELDKDGVKKMAKQFKGILLNSSKKFIKEGAERVWYNNERVKAAELISYLVTHEAVKDDTEFKLIYMKILMCFGFFKIGGDENVTVSSELSATIKSCFYRCFTSRFTNVDTLVSVLSSLCEFVCSILKKEQVRTKIEKQFSKSNMDCWDMVTEICQSIEANECKSKVDNVFLILLYQLGLFLFSDPAHVKMATSSIKELKSCYEHYKKGKKKKEQGAGEDFAEEEPEWIEVLVEVLLSILSVESSVLRAVVQCVFRLLWEYLTPSCIGQIVSVLDPDSDTNPLTQEENSDSEKEDESDNENDDISLNGNEKNGKDSESDDSADDQEEEDEDEEMKTPEQLRLAVQKALGAAADSDNESLDADMIDEEEGKKIDEALAEAFRQFHKGKTTKKDRKGKKALSDFRIRVVDLIDIYLEKEPSIDICLAMIAPLTRCLEFCLQDNQFKELENRVRKTIKNLSKIRKFSSVGDVTIEILGDYLKANIDKGARSQFLFQALGDVITYFATFIIHCSQKVDVNKPLKKKTKSPLIQILKEALQNYFQSRSCLLPIIFFHNIVQADWDGNYELMPVIVENVFNKDVRQFRRNAGLELIAGFYRALKRLKPATEVHLSKLTQLEAQFEDNISMFIKSDTQELKKNFFVILRKVLNTIKQFHESCNIKTTLNFKTLLDELGNKKCAFTKNNKTTPPVQKQNNEHKPKTKKKRKKRKLQADLLNGHSESKKSKKTSEIE